jgi:ATP adenylyltransferase
VTDRLDRMWATWRSDYVADAARPERRQEGCVLCAVIAEGDNQTVRSGTHASVILNRYPYNNGHLMVIPHAHVSDLSDLAPDVRSEVFELLNEAVDAVKLAYEPDGVNFGANLGRGAGAGIPDHLHVHALPRWHGDTNFMTTVAGTRIMPESLEETGAKLRAAFGNR